MALLQTTLPQIERRAFELRTALFELCNQFKILELDIGNVESHSDSDSDWKADSGSDVGSVACKLAKINLELPSLFTDATRR